MFAFKISQLFNIFTVIFFLQTTKIKLWWVSKRRPMSDLNQIRIYSMFANNKQWIYYKLLQLYCNHCWRSVCKFVDWTRTNKNRKKDFTDRQQFHRLRSELSSGVIIFFFLQIFFQRINWRKSICQSFLAIDNLTG